MPFIPEEKLIPQYALEVKAVAGETVLELANWFIVVQLP